jgi:hypothetical protein
MKLVGPAVKNFLCVVGVVCMSSLAWSQATNSGDIRGVVTDTTGALIPDVQVTVVNLNTGVTKGYNPAAFAPPALGTFGDVRRNSLYEPALEYVNMSAGKKFDIHGNVKLQIRVDATNAFNHPSFGQPNGNLSNCSGPPNCPIAQQAGQPYSQQGSFGTNNQISGVSVGGRDLQGGLRLEY